MRAYRARRRQPATESSSTAPEHVLDYLARQVKNKVALDVKRCPAAVWLVCENEDIVKNSIARAQMIVIKCVAPPLDNGSA